MCSRHNHSWVKSSASISTISQQQARQLKKFLPISLHFQTMSERKALSDIPEGWQPLFVSHGAGTRPNTKDLTQTTTAQRSPRKAGLGRCCSIPHAEPKQLFYSSSLHLKVIKKLIPCLKINSEASEQVESLLLILYNCYKTLFFSFHLFTS